MVCTVTQLPFGQDYSLWRVELPHSSVTVTDLGANIQSWTVTREDGRKQELTLNFDEPARYLDVANPTYFGATVGRVANRVSGAVIRNLNGGRDYRLPANEGNGTRTLHGGVHGFHVQKFKLEQCGTAGDSATLVFSHLSRDGEEGFPGELLFRVTYTIAETPEGESTLEFVHTAELVSPEGGAVDETVVATTNHAFFNISDSGSIAGTELRFKTREHLVVDDATLLPTGEVAPFPRLSQRAGAAMTDVLTLQPEPGASSIDHCFVLKPAPADFGVLDTRALPLAHYASLRHPRSRVHLDAYTTDPAFQCYTADNMHVQRDARTAYTGRAALCLEPCRFIDAANKPEWRPMVLVTRSRPYGARHLYKAGIEPAK